MRNDAVLVVVAVSGLALACGTTVIIPGEDGDATGSGAAAGMPSGGTGAMSGTGAASNGSGAASNGSGAGNGAGAGSGSGGFQWAEAFGADGQQHLRGLASDASGDVFITGSFDGTLDFGGGPLKKAGLRSSYVARLHADGKVVWAVPLTADDVRSAAVAVDAAGQVLVTGFVKGTLLVGGEFAASADGIFVVQLDAGGHLFWSRTFGAAADMEPDRGMSIAVGADGRVLVAGKFQGPVDFGGGPIGSGGEGFALVLDPMGNHLWSKDVEGDGAFAALDASGQVIVASDLPGDAMSVRAFDPSGAETWSHDYASGSFKALTVAPFGVVLTGIATTADFGGGPLPSPLPNGEGFVVALDPQGGHLWTRGLPEGSFQSVGEALSVDAAGKVLVTGSFEHQLSTSAVVQSAFLVTFDPAGKQLKSKTFGPSDGAGTVSQEGWGVAPAMGGSLYLGGDFFSTIGVAGVTLSGDGSADVFVARVVP